jgi:hypothetical protein
VTTWQKNDEQLAREGAAFEVVGTLGTLLRTASRDEHGRVTITLVGASLANVVDTFNRATHGDRLSTDSIGR